VKTWWDYYPAMLMGLVLPLLAILLPTGQLKGHVVGGGPVRQTLINAVSKYLPVDAAGRYVEAFNQATVGGEVVLALPVALNISAVVVAFLFVVLSGVMGLSNWMKRGEFSSQRKASKGAQK